MSRFVCLCASVLAVLLTSCSQLRAVPISPTPSPLPAPKPESFPSPQATRVSPVTGSGDLTAADTAVRAAISDAASRLKVASDTIQVVSVSATDWSDTSLGCPQPGMAYIQILMKGHRIQLKAGDRVYVYHSGERQAPFLCENPTGPASVEPR